MNIQDSNIKWSYGIYLYHWPFVVYLTNIFRYPLHANILLVACSVLASITLGFFSFKYIEERINKSATWFKTIMKPLCLMVCAFATVYTVIWTEGLEFRLNKENIPLHKVLSSLTQYDQCRARNYRTPLAELKMCQIEKSHSTRRILILGNSHARHLYPWFLQNTNISVDMFIATACPLLPNLNHHSSTMFYCMDYSISAWKKALSKKYDTIIISMLWVMVTSWQNEYCYQETLSSVCYIPNSTEIYLNSFENIVRSLLAKNKTIVVLDDTPTSWPIHIPIQVLRESFWFRGKIRMTLDIEKTIADNVDWDT